MYTGPGLSPGYPVTWYYPDAQTPTVSGAFIVQAWVYPTNLQACSSANYAGCQEILSTRSGGSDDDNYDFQIGYNGIHTDVGAGENHGWLSTSADASYSFSNNTWYMITAIVQNGAEYFSVNGVYIGGVGISGNPVLMPSTPTSLTLGSYLYNSEQGAFQGFMSNVAVYNYGTANSNYVYPFYEDYELGMVTAPTASTAPVVSGTDTTGHVLSTTNGTWGGGQPGTWGSAATTRYLYQWQRCSPGCVSISGATSSTYTLTTADVGTQVKSRVEAYNAAGDAAGTSEATPEISATTPVNTVAPAVTGEAKDGSVLTTTNGTWEGSPSPTYTYQWQRFTSGSWVNITGATSSTYTLADTEYGHKVRAVVTASNASSYGGSAVSKESNESSEVQAVPPVNTAAPAISGTAQNGSTLTATNGVWSGAPAPTYTYQWQRFSSGSWASISGATASSYTLVNADTGHKIRIIVTATNASYTGGGTASKESNESGLVQATTPVNTVAPAVTGEAKDGSVLTTTNGTWTGAPEPTYTYQWQRFTSGSWANISGATSTTYTLADADVAHKLRAVVTASNVAFEGGSAVSANSNESGEVQAVPPANTTAPVVSGTAQNGSTLTATNGVWTGAPAPTYSYQWQRLSGSWVNISGATSSNYTLVSADTGHKVRIVVTASNSSYAGGSSASKESNESGLVQATTPVNTVAPAVSGEAKDGSTLTTTNGTWTGAPEPTYSYQWQRFAGSWANISGATSTTYTLADADVGHKVRAVVTASNASFEGGSAVTANSNESGEVQAVPPANTAAPVVSGEVKDGSSLTATTGSWSGSPSPTYSYQWQREVSGSWGNISGATSSTYVVTDSDVSHNLRVVVTATNASYVGGGSASKESASTSESQASPPSNSAAPVLSGTTKDGSVLSVTNGAWSGAPAPTYTYQWQRDSGGGESYVSISGAEAATYTLANSDVGYKIRVIVTASNSAYPGGSSASKESNESAKVEATTPASTVAPVVSGSSSDGSTLTTTNGSWSGAPAPTYSYQWQRNSGGGESYVNISAATGSSYVLTDSDVGYKLRAVVTASNASSYGGSAVTANSNETAKTKAVPPVNTTAPTVSGEVSDGSVLTATTGSWSGAPAPTYSYQWQRETSGSWGNISGATTASYTVVDSDVGHALRVVVTASNASYYEGGSASKESASTSEGQATPPSNTAAPVVSGTTKDGSSLSVTTGTWSGSPAPTYTYQWQRNSGSGESYLNISGATSSSYTLGDADVSYKLRAIVTASNSAYPGGASASKESNESAQVQAVPPVSTAAPVVSGSSSDGSTLTATNGSWSGSPAPTFTYQWQRDSGGGEAYVDITGANSTSYVLADADVGYKLRVVVTASNAAYVGGGSANAASNATSEVQAVPPVNTVAPAVSGQAQDGSVLSATTGSWSGAPAPTYSYQWQRNSGGGESFVNISGATSSSYTLGDADVSYKLRVVVSASNASYSGGAVVAANSNESEIVQAAGPVNTAAPVVSGEAKDGSVLTTTNGTWNAAPPLTYTYQWQRDSGVAGAYVDISGATSSSYTLGDADVGYTVQAVVTATNASYTGGSSASATSNESSEVQAVPPTNTAAPAVSGTAKDGHVLSVTNGSWSGAPAPTYSYQWQRCDSGGGSCANISGATSSTYHLVDADVGHVVKAVVTASNASYAGGGNATASASSSVVEAVPPTNTSLPEASGSAVSTHTLTATNGTWNAAPAPTYTYQWRRCNSGGESCSSISGATASTYTLTGEDVGHTIKVAVTASNASYVGGGVATATSEATETVVSNETPPGPPSTPTLSTNTPAYGQSIHSSEGTGSTGGAPAPTYGYQWQRCTSTEASSCVDISGATSRFYATVEADVGNYLRVGVTASNSDGHETSYSAESTSGVTGVPPSQPSTPSLSTSRPIVGHPVTTEGTGSTGEPRPTYLYQWQQCITHNTSTCSNINGATSSSYSPVSNEMGTHLRVAVESENSTGTWVDPSEPSYSPESEPVEESSESFACENVSPAPGGSSPTGPAVACTEAEEAVSGSALTLTAPSTRGASPVTLGPKDQISSYTIAELTGDNTGTGHGWNETISQTPFVSGAHTLGLNEGSGESFEATSGAGKVGKAAGRTGGAVTLVTVANAHESTNTIPSEEEAPVTLPLNVPVPTSSATATAGDSPSVIFQTADLATGLGNFTITPTVSFDMPANTYAGSYTATTEVDLTTGP